MLNLCGTAVGMCSLKVTKVQWALLTVWIQIWKDDSGRNVVDKHSYLMVVSDFCLILRKSYASMYR